VSVLIAADNGALVEKGEAVATPSDPTHFTYTTTAKAPASAVKVIVDVADLAGHVSEKTQELGAAAH